MPIKSIRGSILNPRDDGSVEFIRDGVIHGDETGSIIWVGDWNRDPFRATRRHPIERTTGIICPAFFDNHIHIPQHPIRGHFMDGVAVNPPEGRLLAGLNRNVFPAEAKCNDPSYTRGVVNEFLRETLSQGVIGGAAYMTVHASAASIALETLPSTWHAGLVLMNQNCPEYLRTDEANFERDATDLAQRFGARYIVTDRFAVAVNSQLRRRAVAISREFGLRMQTHLNEQLSEKKLVEMRLYAGRTYAGVYHEDGLLQQQAILGHCVHMADEELDLVAKCGASIAHCPTSNALLCSGIMPLDRIKSAGIDYAICTDVGASPTTSLLYEMAQFLAVHEGRNTSATACEALYRVTLAPVRMLGFADRLGSFAPGKLLTFLEVHCDELKLDHCNDAEAVIRFAMLNLPAHHDAQLITALDRLATGTLDASDELRVIQESVEDTRRRLDHAVKRVVVAGEVMFERPGAST